MTTLEELRTALIELDEQLTLELTRRLLEQGRVAPMSILATCQQALKVVGERYERQEYFISGLIMAGELFKEVLDLVQPQEQTPSGTGGGTVLLGTVAGDIHDIGKNMFATSLRGFDFQVIDLGVDVSPEKFLAETARSRPDVVCLSGLIMVAFESMKATVNLLRSQEAHLGYRPPIVLGGVDHRRPRVPVRGGRFVEHGRYGRRPHLPGPRREGARVAPGGLGRPQSVFSDRASSSSTHRSASQASLRCSGAGSAVVTDRCSALPPARNTRLAREVGRRPMSRKNSSATPMTQQRVDAAEHEGQALEHDVADEGEEQGDDRQVGTAPIVDAAVAGHLAQVVEVGPALVGVDRLVLGSVVPPDRPAQTEPKRRDAQTEHEHGRDDVGRRACWGRRRERPD